MIVVPSFVTFWHASNLLDVAIAITISSVYLSVCSSVTTPKQFKTSKYGLHHRHASFNPVVGRFGTNHELNSGKGTIASHFGLSVIYHNIPHLGSDKGIITS